MRDSRSADIPHDIRRWYAPKRYHSVDRLSANQRLAVDDNGRGGIEGFRFLSAQLIPVDLLATVWHALARVKAAFARPTSHQRTDTQVRCAWLASRGGRWWTEFRKPLNFGVPRGIRTPVTAVKGRCPRPG